jgi:tetratricopeptide (TPR) repeat protein
MSQKIPDMDRSPVSAVGSVAGPESDSVAFGPKDFLHSLAVPLVIIRSLLSMRFRSARRFSARLLGKVQRRISTGWIPVVLWMAAVFLALTLLPVLVQLCIDGLADLGFWSFLGVESTPHVGDWFSLPALLAVFAAGLLLRALVRARSRVVVQQFVDYTQGDATAVQGMATLLVAELSRLRQLYRVVNDDLSVPLAVGVERRGGFGRGKDAGSFLTVQAEEVTDVLSSAVASEAKAEVGPVMIPIGAVLAALGRLMRGPRVVGSVHRTDAGGGPTLAAQIVGSGPVLTWRVDHAANGEQAKTRAYVPGMVAEMAMRMFTDLTLEGAVRWKAAQAFTRYLELYQASLRNPCRRARFLKQAESKLIAAIAEDDSFDLGFYNLGVIYSQLAQQELTAAEATDVVRWRADVFPKEIRKARTAAATMAFRRALERNRGRWHAHYALAVHRFSSMEPLGLGDTPGSTQVRDLREVAALCQRAIELQPKTARVEDLLGMALVRLGQFEAGMKAHRRAVRRWWRDLCRMERQEAACPGPTPASLDRIRANAAAALHNVGLAHLSRGKRRSSSGGRLSVASVSFFRASLHFRQASKLAPPQSEAASHFERGRAQQEWGRPRRAAACFREAVQIQPYNPEYRAALAYALAKPRRSRRHRALRREAETTQALHDAFVYLTPVFARSVERFAPPSVIDTCEASLVILRDTFQMKFRDGESIAELRKLRKQLEHQLRPDRGNGLGSAIAELEGRLTVADAGRAADSESQQAAWSGRLANWRHQQLELALARLYADAGRWAQAEQTLERVIGYLEESDHPLTIEQLGLHVRRAQLHRRMAACAQDETRREQLREALRIAQRALRADPLSAAGRREAGRIHFELEQYEEALEAWTQALALVPNDPTLYWRLGRCHWRIAEQRRDSVARNHALSNAADFFEQTTILCGGEYEESKAWAHLWHGRVLLKMDRVDEAVAELRSALTFPATRAAASAFLGEAALTKADYEGAAESLQVARLEVEQAVSGNGARLSSRDFDQEEFADDLTLAELRSRILSGLMRANQASNGGHRLRSARVRRMLEHEAQRVAKAMASAAAR